MPTYRVCIIGAGPQGLAALKNLLELNRPDALLFEPEILESRDSIGGLWAYSDDADVTTVLKSTLSNVSKWKSCYADFPVDEAWRAAGKSGSAPAHLEQSDVLMYLNRYAERFGLNPYIRLGHEVSALTRNEDGDSWEVATKDKATGTNEVKLYDKVIVASGAYSTPITPQIDGIEDFGGTVIHSSAFKNAAQFSGDRVLVVGFGNTAADISADLAGTASKIYLSHRRGNYIFPRIVQNKPVDLLANRRMNAVKSTLASIAPTFVQGAMDDAMRKISDGAFGHLFRPEWRFRPVPVSTFARPLISDTLIPLLESGAVTSVREPKRATGGDTVELEDGSSIQVDAIILCTGYKRNAILHSVVERSGSPPLPRLYQNIFHHDHGSSLAYMDSWFMGTGICEAADLISMAIAQVYSGRYKLPSSEAINQQIDQHHGFVRAAAARETGPVSVGAMEQVVNDGPWRAFLHDAAGTEVNEMLGYGSQGWRFWWSDRELCNLLMGGIESPHLYRLFKGKERARPTWKPARGEIEKANEQVIEFEEMQKEGRSE